MTFIRICGRIEAVEVAGQVVPPLPTKSWAQNATVAVLIAQLACAVRNPASGPATTCSSATGAQLQPAAPATDSALFGQLITKDAVLNDPVRRKLSRADPPSAYNGQLQYAFELEPQPGMLKLRHFDIITVTVAPAGTFVRVPLSKPSLGGLAGPNGSFVDATLQTSDRRYDLRISEAMLLPDSVELKPFDVSEAVTSLARRYRAATPAGCK